MENRDDLSIQFIEQYPSYVPAADEAYMNADQLKHFHDKLVAWKEILMKGVDSTVTHLKNDSEIPADPNDRATQEEEFAIVLRTRDRERKLIQKIDETLIKIHNEEYGYCEISGEEIGLPRLEARPTATLCLAEKNQQEKKEKLGV